MTQDEDHVYKVINVVGSSPEGIEPAIDRAIEKASESVDNMRWFEVDETRGHIDEAEVAHYQVVLSVGFTVE